MPSDSTEQPAPRAEDSDGAAFGIACTTKEIVMGSVRSGHSVHPLFDKFGSRHVTQFLKQWFESDVARHKTARGGRWFRLVHVSLGVGAFAILTVALLPDRSDLYFRVLQGIGVFAAGLAAGYGIRAYQDRRSACQR